VPITLDATPGGASANSYGDLAGADAYFTERLGGDVWFSFSGSPEIQKAGLITGTRSIDAQVYRGQRGSSTQARQFPRTGIYIGGVALDPSAVPRFVVEANYEETLALMTAAGADGSTNPLAATGLEQFKALAVGDIRLDMRDLEADTAVRNFASPQAYRLLRPYILTQFINERASVRNVRVLR
jgi:hypothetical protein